LLIPFDELDEEGKESNLATAEQAVRTIIGLGYQISPPIGGIKHGTT
jgi:hypothetical protein